MRLPIRNRLRKALKKNYESYRTILVDEVEAQSGALKVTNVLTYLFPLYHKGTASYEHKDFVHIVLARAMRDVLWLGWVSEAKYRRGAYDKDGCKFIRESLSDAFEIGRKYAKERP